MRNPGPVLAALAALIVGPASAVAQQGSVTGRVIDASSGQGLPAAQVFIQGTNLGALTNDDGRFLILNVPVGEQTASVVLLGYGPQTRTVAVTEGAAATVDFQLQQTAIGLEEVVVTATGEQRKIEIANSLGEIDASELMEVVPVTNLSQLLQGRSSGVVVGASSGTTGMGSRVRIRGSSSIGLSNQPLIYVDGIRIDSDTESESLNTGGQNINRLDDINPENIASIEIVKGPSAATLYGTEAANGVIRITTKRGRAGETRFNVWTEYGVIDDENDYPLNWGGRDAAGESCNLIGVAAGECTQASLTSYSPLFDPELTPLTTGQRRQTGASLSGGGGGITYYLSGEWEEEQGPLGTPAFYFDDLTEAGIGIDEDIINPNRFERQSFRTNVTAQIAENATGGIRIGYISAKRRFPINDNSSGGLMPSAFFGGADPNDVENAWGFLTPAQVLGQDNQQNIQRFTSSLTGTVKPMEWLTLRGTGGLDFSSRHDFSHEMPGLESPNDDGSRDSNFAEIYQYTVDLGATGEFAVSDAVSSRTTLGTQFFHDIFHDVQGSGEQLVPGSESLETAAETDSDESTIENRTVGVFIDQQFAINDRLYVNAAVRADDNSAFGQDFDLIYYPKAGLSWVMSDEPFFPELGWLDLLRLRGAWGASGRQPNSDDAIRTLDVNAIANPDDEIVSGVELGEAGNTLLKPERSSEFELGFDADLLGGRAGLVFTWFQRVTKDIIVEEPLPPSLGSSDERFQNLGQATTSGFEVGINAAVLEGDNFGWDVSFSGSLLNSELDELGLPGVEFLGNQLRHQPGYPLGSQFDFTYTYADANGDGIIAVDELMVQDSGRVFVGAGLPQQEFSLTNTFRIGSYVRIYALIDHQGDYIANNNTEGFRCQFRTCRAIQDPNAPLRDQARQVGREQAGTSTEWGYMEEGDFFKLREVSLTLVAPQAWLAPVRASNASLTLSARNLVTWTDYTGIDPEINSGGSGDNFGTSEFLTQGIPRYLTARLSLSF